MAVDYGIRQGLRNQGFTNEDIGFDKGTGFVQLKGQNFLKPEMNVNGTTFTSEDNFNNSLNQFKKNQQAQQTQQLTDQLISGVTNPQPVVNPYVDQFNQLIADIQSRMNQPTPDVYSTPQFTAAQAQQERAADEGIRAAQESLGSAGFGRSTTLGESAQRVQNRADEFLQTQLVPQILNQLQAQRQQEIANQFNLLSPITTQLNREDTLQRNKQSDLASIVEFLTGRQDRSEDIQRGDQQLADAAAYRDARDAIADERYKIEFDRDVKQSGLEFALEKAKLNNQITQQNIDNALQRERFNFEKDQAANEVLDNGVGMGEEKRGLADALRAGELTPTQAIQQIKEDAGLGFYTKEQAAELESVITSLTPNLPSSKVPVELTAEQEDSLPSDKEIDKIWEQQGKEQGLPRIDFRAWYKDPQGRLAGVDYETWKKVYGPQLKAR